VEAALTRAARIRSGPSRIDSEEIILRSEWTYAAPSAEMWTRSTTNTPAGSIGEISRHETRRPLPRSMRTIRAGREDDARA